MVDQGVKAYNEARFEDALSAFRKAEQSSELNLDELVQLLESKALVLSALEKQDEAEECLKDLAALRPTHRLPASVPPGLVETFEKARSDVPGPVMIALKVRRDESQVFATARVKRNARIVRKMIVYQRADDGEWISNPDEGAISATEHVDSYAEAFGDGGVLLASAFNAKDPQRTLLTESSLSKTDQSFPRPLNIGALISFGVAAAGLTLFSVSGILALTAKNDLDDSGCRENMCPVADIERADRLALMADIGLGVAIAGAVAGVLFLVLRPKAKEDKLLVMPAFGPDSYGLSAHGRF